MSRSDVYKLGTQSLLFSMARVMVPPTFDEQFDELFPPLTTIEELFGDLRWNLFVSLCIWLAQTTNGLFSSVVRNHPIGLPSNQFHRALLAGGFKLKPFYLTKKLCHELMSWIGTFQTQPSSGEGRASFACQGSGPNRVREGKGWRERERERQTFYVHIIHPLRCIYYK